MESFYFSNTEFRAELDASPEGQDLFGKPIKSMRAYDCYANELRSLRMTIRREFAPLVKQYGIQFTNSPPTPGRKMFVQKPPKIYDVAEKVRGMVRMTQPFESRIAMPYGANNQPPVWGPAPNQPPYFVNGQPQVWAQGPGQPPYLANNQPQQAWATAPERSPYFAHPSNEPQSMGPPPADRPLPAARPVFIKQEPQFVAPSNYTMPAAPGNQQRQPVMQQQQQPQQTVKPFAPTQAAHNVTEDPTIPLVKGVLAMANQVKVKPLDPAAISDDGFPVKQAPKKVKVVVKKKESATTPLGSSSDS